MLAATVAELAQFDPLGCRLPVFGLRVIALFAITALQRNDLSGHCSLPKQLLALKLLALMLCNAGALARETNTYVTISEIVPAPTV
jgi:hypothetical protein